MGYARRGSSPRFGTIFLLQRLEKIKKEQVKLEDSASRSNRILKKQSDNVSDLRDNSAVKFPARPRKVLKSNASNEPNSIHPGMALLNDKSESNKQLLEEIDRLKRKVDRLEAEKNKLSRIRAKIQDYHALLENVVNDLPFWFSVKDRQGNYLMVNRKMAEAHGISVTKLISQKKLETAKLHPGGLSAMIQRDMQVLATGQRLEVSEYPVNTNEGLRWRRLVKIPWRNEKSDIIGVISWSEDITERKYSDEERDRLLEDLQAALQEIRTLSGILPICAHCKKIRDDEGYWNRLEDYIESHSQAQLTHGVCPECAKLLYPDVYKES